MITESVDGLFHCCPPVRYPFYKPNVVNYAKKATIVSGLGKGIQGRDAGETPSFGALIRESPIRLDQDTPPSSSCCQLKCVSLSRLDILASCDNVVSGMWTLILAVLIHDLSFRWFSEAINERETPSNWRTS